MTEAIIAGMRRCSKGAGIRQLSLFPERICFAYLLAADSPKCAFYRIWIELNAGIFTVLKESGIKGRVLDKRAWPFASIDEARSLFDRRIKDKTNPERRSPRKYSLVCSI